MALAAYSAPTGATVPAEITIEVTGAVLRPGLAKGLPAVAYAAITDRSGRGDVLLGVTIAGADASLHETSEAGGISRMRPVASVPLPPGGNITMKPGGIHIMIMGLGAVESKTVPMKLRFKNAVEITADFTVAQ